MFNIIFPSQFGHRTVINASYIKEAAAAKQVGFDITISSDMNMRGPLSLHDQKKNLSVYRGWVVKPQYYQELSQGVRGTLLNSCDQFMWSYDFPKWYQALESETPQSWVYPSKEVVESGIDMIAAEMCNKAGEIGPKPLIVKDYIKSRKAEWWDAAYIADARVVGDIKRCLANFFQLMGREYYGGLVFRQFLPLIKIGDHPATAMPLPVEFRVWFVYGKVMSIMPYWNDVLSYPEKFEWPPQSWLSEIGDKLQSSFVALDIAQDVKGRWWVIEVNDGGMAGYPRTVKPEKFYGLLMQALQKHNQ